jgi:hypothetical protein
MSAHNAPSFLKLAWLAVMIVLAPAMALGADVADKRSRSRTKVPFLGPVPAANCGATDWTETGVQGQTTTAERVSGLSELGFQCNLELVGQYQGQGSKWMMNWFGDCAYMGQAPNFDLLRHPGVVVIDASNPRRPRPITWLDSPTMRDPHEGISVNERRKILASTQFGPGYDFAVYDLSADCRAPRLASSITLPRNPNTSPNAGPDGGHAGSLAPDGMTYYGSHAFRGLGGIVSIVDLTDINNPKSIIEYQYPGDGRGHDYAWSADGMLMYANQPGQFGTPPTGSSYGPNGLVILDVSDIQLRRPNPQLRVISTLFHEDGGQGQQPAPIYYKGVPHLILTDEAGSGGAGGPAGACARGVNGFSGGFPRIVDVSDALHPTEIAKLMLETHDVRNCDKVLPDPAPNNYSSHYCSADRQQNPRALACTSFSAGVRVFDIRDPYNPREIAYYKPPARRTQFLPGSALWSPNADRTADLAPSVLRWRHYKDEVHLWFVSQDNGFQIIAFTNDVLKGIIPDDEIFDGDNHKPGTVK